MSIRSDYPYRVHHFFNHNLSHKMDCGTVASVTTVRQCSWRK